MGEVRAILRVVETVRGPQWPETVEIKKCEPVQVFQSGEAVEHIFDASPAENIILPEWISNKTIVASPGIPLGLTVTALKKLGPGRLIHDPLQLGVAVMASMCISP